MYVSFFSWLVSLLRGKRLRILTRQATKQDGVRGSSLKVPEKCPDYYGICPDILKKSQNKNPPFMAAFWSICGLTTSFQP
jgi:hypothetical protein